LINAVTQDLPVRISPILRVMIDGSWAATDFADYFTSLDTLYRFFTVDTPPRSGNVRRPIRFRGDKVEQLDDEYAKTVGEANTGDQPFDHLAVAFERTALERFDLLPTDHTTGSRQARVNALFVPALKFMRHLEEFATATYAALWNEWANGIDGPRGQTGDDGPKFPSLENPEQWRPMPRFPSLRSEAPSELEVRRCKFASPGVTDLSGLAGALKHIKDLVLFLIKNAAEAPLRREKLRTVQIKNIGLQVDLLVKLGYTKSQIRSYLGEVDEAMEKLAALANSRRIHDVAMLDRDEPGKHS